MMYGMLAFSVFLALLYNVLFRLAAVGDSFLRTLRLNTGVAAVSALMALLLGGRLERPQIPTLMWGMLYGISMSLNLLSRTKALETGPLSLTLLIGCSSMVLSTLFGTLLWRESATLSQIAGVAVMLLAMITSLKSSKGGTISGKWAMYSLGLFFTNGANGLILKAHQSTFAAEQYGLFLTIGFAVSALCMSLLACFVRIRNGESSKFDRRLAVSALLCGGAGCGYNLLNTLLSGAIPSVVFFPVFNGSVIVFSLPVAMALFREKATRRQMASIVLAIAAILLIGNVIRLGTSA